MVKSISIKLTDVIASYPKIVRKSDPHPTYKSGYNTLLCYKVGDMNDYSISSFLVDALTYDGYLDYISDKQSSLSRGSKSRNVLGEDDTVITLRASRPGNASPPQIYNVNGDAVNISDEYEKFEVRDIIINGVDTRLKGQIGKSIYDHHFVCDAIINAYVSSHGSYCFSLEAIYYKKPFAATSNLYKPNVTEESIRIFMERSKKFNKSIETLSIVPSTQTDNVPTINATFSEPIKEISAKTEESNVENEPIKKSSFNKVVMDESKKSEESHDEFKNVDSVNHEPWDDF